MAVVKILKGDNAKRVLRYVFNHSLPGDPIDEHEAESNVEGAIEQFRQVRQQHDFQKGRGEVMHLVQSWDEHDSKKMKPEEFNLMGRKLVEEYFKGHQFVVVTHTDTDHTHNHIVVNRVNMDTGKLIEKKYKHLHELRKQNDKLCLAVGLKIPNQDANVRRDNVPEKVRQMVRFNKESWVMDIRNKADVARHMSTSYDEYTGYLSAFGIRARVEDKNITYFYSGRSRGKRGDKLGKVYDKHGLEEQFRANDALFASRPDIRERLRATGSHFAVPGNDTLRNSGAVLLESGVQGRLQSKEYSKFTKTDRRTVGSKPLSDRELSHSILPVSEVSRARGNILEYCKKNKIQLVQNERGKTVLKGREHVMITDFTAINTKNGTHGTLIDFVAAHHNLTLIQAVARINNNPNLLLLEKHFGEVKRKYTSFYIPKNDQMDWGNSSKKLSLFLKHKGVDESLGSKMMHAQQASVSKSGSVHLFSEGSSSGSFEFSEGPNNSWNEKAHGHFTKPFHTRNTQSKKSTLFISAFDFLSHGGPRAFSDSKRGDGIIALMKPDHAIVDLFLAENSHVKELNFFIPKNRSLHPSELDFFNVLKGRLNPLGIEVKQVSSPHLNKSKGLELEI